MAELDGQNLRPILEPEVVKIRDISPPAKEDASKALQPQQSRSVQPFTYDYQSGSTIYLSKREKFLADTFLDSMNYAYSAAMVRKQFHSKTTDMSVRDWLNRKHVQEYLAHRLKERGLANGLTKDSWLADTMAYREGRKQANASTVKMHELLGRAMGYLDDQSKSVSLNAENMQINFTERAE